MIVKECTKGDKENGMWFDGFSVDVKPLVQDK